MDTSRVAGTHYSLFSRVSGPIEQGRASVFLEETKLRPLAAVARRILPRFRNSFARNGS